MNENQPANELSKQVSESAGSDYLNRAHKRSFSLNVFQMNAVELIGAAQRVKDPDQGMALMMEKNREASLQAHRELNRYVHNFVSSALTLVEHTRGFMRKHYAGTDLMAAYEAQVTTTVSSSPVAQFVQGLRNYMLHRGLPSSSMFLNFKSDPAGKNGSGTMETGVRYHTASLLDWKDWKPAARMYLEAAGEYVDLYEFAQEYLTLINQFHGWLDATLATHHKLDLRKLSQLQAQQNAGDTTAHANSTVPVETLDLIIAKPFGFAATQVQELDRISLELFNKVCELSFHEDPKGFPTERPITTITDHDLIGPITGWVKQSNGGTAFMFVRHDNKIYGLRESDYEGTAGLIEAVMKSPWACSSLSHEFVETAFFDWARQRLGGEGASFSDVLIARTREQITTVEVWAPIDHTEVEHGFNFGPVRIEPVTAAAMKDLRSRTSAVRPEQMQQVDQLFDRLKQEIQGYAAVVISMEAEPILAHKRALQIARDVVALLRFFSPAASISLMFSPIALTGATCIPTSNLIVLHKDGFTFSQETLPKNVGYWRLSRQRIAALQSDFLDEAALLVLPENLDEFALAVRASLMTYSKGATLTDPLDRLRSCIYAVEGILLRHEMEPRAHSIANRMSFLLAQGDADRQIVKQIVRQVYWLQAQPQLTRQGRLEDELIAAYVSYAYLVLRVALANISRFNSKSHFVMEVDRAGLSSNN